VSSQLQRCAPQQQEELGNLRHELSNTLSELGMVRVELSSALAERHDLQSKLSQAMDKIDHSKMELDRARHDLHEENQQLRSQLAKAISFTTFYWTSEVNNLTRHCLTELGNPQDGQIVSEEQIQILKKYSEWEESIAQGFVKGPAQAIADKERFQMELLEEQAKRDKNHRRPSTLQRKGKRHEDEPSAQAKIDEKAFEQCKLELQSSREENEQLRLELESLRQMSAAARWAEDELPKVLEHCARQENLLMQLTQQFKLVQVQLDEKTKALKELQAQEAGAAVGRGKKGVEDDLGGALGDACNTLKALNSANTTLRTSLTTFKQAKQWGDTKSTFAGGQSARATWSGGTAWTDFSSSKRNRKPTGKDRMSRSQVSFASFHEEV